MSDLVYGVRRVVTVGRLRHRSCPLPVSIMPYSIDKKASNFRVVFCWLWLEARPAVFKPEPGQAVMPA